MKNNENKKKKWKEALIDALLELAIAIVLCAVGIGIFALFGKKLDEIDIELALLVGVAVVIIPTVIVLVIVHKIRSKKSIEEKEKLDGISPENQDAPKE